MAAYRWVSTSKMDSIIGRLQKKTIAYTASNAGFDNQQVNVSKLVLCIYLIVLVKSCVFSFKSQTLVLSYARCVGISAFIYP